MARATLVFVDYSVMELQCMLKVFASVRLCLDSVCVRAGSFRTIASLLRRDFQVTGSDPHPIYLFAPELCS